MIAALAFVPSASAAPRLVAGGSSTWTPTWSAEWFASSTGHVDVWYICTPISNATAARGLELGFWKEANPGYVQVRPSFIGLPCDRTGHWLRNVAVPKNTWLSVESSVYGEATGHTSVYGYGSARP